MPSHAPVLKRPWPAPFSLRLPPFLAAQWYQPSILSGASSATTPRQPPLIRGPRRLPACLPAGYLPRACKRPCLGLRRPPQGTWVGGNLLPPDSLLPPGCRPSTATARARLATYSAPEASSQSPPAIASRNRLPQSPDPCSRLRLPRRSPAHSLYDPTAVRSSLVMTRRVRRRQWHPYAA